MTGKKRECVSRGNSRVEDAEGKTGDADMSLEARMNSIMPGGNVEFIAAGMEGDYLAHRRKRGMDLPCIH